MQEYRLCEICEHKNNVAHLECEACGADISYISPTTASTESSGNAPPQVSPVIPIPPVVIDDQSRATTVMTAIKLVSTKDGFEIKILPAGCMLGREGDIAREYFEQNSTFVSRRHLQVISRSGVYYIIDQNTVNGTQINKQPVCGMEEKRLDIGDTLVMADLEFIVSRG